MEGGGDAGEAAGDGELEEAAEEVLLGEGDEEKGEEPEEAEVEGGEG